MNQVLLNIIAQSVQDEVRNARTMAFSIARNMPIATICETFYDGFKIKFPDRWNDWDVSLAIEQSSLMHEVISDLNVDLKTCFDPEII